VGSIPIARSNWNVSSRAVFHFSQNYSFVAKLHGKFGANVVEGNLASVPV
jgi:hypothetical protein